MSSIKVIIAKATNGFTLSHEEEITVIESDSKEKIVDLLYNILTCLDESNDKHAAETIQIRVVHGSHYECKDKDCKICKKRKR